MVLTFLKMAADSGSDRPIKLINSPLFNLALGDFLHGWCKEGVIENLLDYCTYNDGSGPIQCGIDKGEPTQCIWEGSEDDSQYKGILDELPPWTNDKNSDCFDHGIDYFGNDLNPGQYTPPQKVLKLVKKPAK